ncbi:hypothetical protein [Pseudomonas sp. HLT2-19-2]
MSSHAPALGLAVLAYAWRVGKEKYACILTLTTDQNATPANFKDLLSVHEELVHITVEINQTARSNIAA